MVELVEMIKEVLPIIIIDVVFKVYAIVDIFNVDRKVKGGNKIVWLLVAVLINYGWVIYFIFGKDE